MGRPRVRHMGHCVSEAEQAEHTHMCPQLGNTISTCRDMQTGHNGRASAPSPGSPAPSSPSPPAASAPPPPAAAAPPCSRRARSIRCLHGGSAQHGSIYVLFRLVKQHQGRCDCIH